MEYQTYIGKKVQKVRVKSNRTPKPFKSGNRINTVKGIVVHPQLNVPAFTFFEDDSYVDCRKCGIVDENGGTK